MSVTKIVLTGGPCGGKSTGLDRVKRELDRLGYTVYTVAETATELITGGIAPNGLTDNYSFQRCIFRLQRLKEQVYEQAAKMNNSDKTVILCDRGLIDNKGYMTPEEFDRILAENQTNEIAVRDSYDAVFHLVTAANGALEYYTTKNNQARSETPEQAVALDNGMIHSWTGHPHFRIIDNSTGFEQKINRLLIELRSFLGEPEPFETERKFLIEYPELSLLQSLPNCRKSEILQTYLKKQGNTEIRVRQRGENGCYSFYETKKETVSGLQRIETERRITEQEYLSLLMQADPDLKPVRKNRYCLSENGLYYEIDVYPFWNDRAIMEIELTSPDAPIVMPSCVKVIKEVTSDPAYKNAALAKRS